MDYTYTFKSLDKDSWLRTIVNIYEQIHHDGDRVILEFSDEINSASLKPFHIVTYACLIQDLINRNCSVNQGRSNKEVANYIYYDLGLQYYWKGVNHVDVEDRSILNLWRIIESEKDIYSRQVEEYFKNTFFTGKDTSRIQLSIVEAFYNVDDHAEANGNAFFFVLYDNNAKILSVAIADFGKGIATSVKEFDNSITKDEEALLRAIQEDFTVASTTHNKGKGLATIINCSDKVCIISGSASLEAIKDHAVAQSLGYEMPGTLIFFDIDLSNLEQEDILDEFSF